ncbi:hypothetical protein COI_2156 [Mannheimia haemolytica serotype A2 str. OVINE]|nr:hypothetical protein COI_2156 [Mannheimia haemolytica serotype A2 str. OVINE]
MQGCQLTTYHNPNNRTYIHIRNSIAFFTYSEIGVSSRSKKSICNANASFRNFQSVVMSLTSPIAKSIGLVEPLSITISTQSNSSSNNGKAFSSGICLKAASATLAIPNIPSEAGGIPSIPLAKASNAREAHLSALAIGISVIKNVVPASRPFSIVIFFCF